MKPSKSPRMSSLQWCDRVAVAKLTCLIGESVASPLAIGSRPQWRPLGGLCFAFFGQRNQLWLQYKAVHVYYPWWFDMEDRSHWGQLTSMCHHLKVSTDISSDALFILWLLYHIVLVSIYFYRIAMAYSNHPKPCKIIQYSFGDGSKPVKLPFNLPISGESASINQLFERVPFALTHNRCTRVRSCNTALTLAGARTQQLFRTRNSGCVWKNF